MSVGVQGPATILDAFDLAKAIRDSYAVEVARAHIAGQKPERFDQDGFERWDAEVARLTPLRQAHIDEILARIDAHLAGVDA